MKEETYKKTYRQDIDVIKGFAILAVMLFHYGLLRTGYLGVDTFFVINGFFIIPSVIWGIQNGNFSYFDFLKKRLTRLFPLVLIICLCSLIFGCIFLLPYELERTARSVIASCLLSENLRCAFTWGNYWEVANDYSPLFHLWYVGILFEFYLLFPLVILILKRIKIGGGKMAICTIALLFISCLLYLMPFDTSLKFYLLPFRFFEIALGGVVGLYIRRNGTYVINNFINVFSITAFFALVVVLLFAFFTIGIDGIGHQVIPQAPYGIGLTAEGLHYSPTLMLFLTVILTAITLLKSHTYLWGEWIAWFGKRSYSLFIWHQFVLAFYRNTISDEITIQSTIIYIGISILLSQLTYKYIEKKIVTSLKTVLICIISSFVLIIPASYIYFNGGIIRDIPELNFKQGEGYTNIAVAYVDVPKEYNDISFPNNGKKNVLIIGNSFARDFCNILRESKFNSYLNYSVSFSGFPSDKEILSNADYIFSFLRKELLTDSISRLLKDGCKYYGIGTKNFGNSNNQYYSHRWSKDYFYSSAVLPKEYKKANDVAKEHWGSAYIDLIEPAMIDSVRVRVFTPDNKFISQDCRHLTPAGAKWYASVLDLDRIFK